MWRVLEIGTAQSCTAGVLAKCRISVNPQPSHPRAEMTSRISLTLKCRWVAPTRNRPVPVPVPVPIPAAKSMAKVNCKLHLKQLTCATDKRN